MEKFGSFQHRNSFRNTALAATAAFATGMTHDHVMHSAPSQPVTNHQESHAEANRLAQRAEHSHTETTQSLRELLSQDFLTHNQLQHVGKQLTQELISTGKINRYYGDSRTAHESFEGFYNRLRSTHFQREIHDVKIGFEHALQQAASTARNEGRRVDYVRLLELVHPWDGLEAALAVHEPHLALEIVRHNPNLLDLIVMKGSGTNAQDKATVQYLITLFSPADLRAVQRVFLEQYEDMLHSQERVRTRTANASTGSPEEQAYIRQENAQLEQERNNLLAFGRQLRRR